MNSGCPLNSRLRSFLPDLRFARIGAFRRAGPVAGSAQHDEKDMP